MIIYTSRYNYRGADRMDITTRSVDPIGSFFAPSQSIVIPYLSGQMTEQQYTRLYEHQLNELKIKHPEIWLAMIGLERATVVCFCDSANFCHRFVLARYLVEMGSTYGGEINA